MTAVNLIEEEREGEREREREKSNAADNCCIFKLFTCQISAAGLVPCTPASSGFEFCGRALSWPRASHRTTARECYDMLDS